jgi:histidinol-phosphatase (PHP family)
MSFKRFDCHMHTPFCGHAVGEPEAYVRSAAGQGLDLITFTCHIPMDGPDFAQEGIRMRRKDLEGYKAAVASARKLGETLGVEVLCGIEAEISPDEAAMASMDSLLASESFDYILGSLHHMLPGFRQWLLDNGCTTDRDKIEAYFHCLGEGARSGRYNSIAHPDVIRIYSTLENGFNPAAHRPAIETFLDRVAATDVCLEFNTSGLIKGDYVLHPDPLITGWALERGIPFTFGSDAHHHDRVGHALDEVIDQFHPMGLDTLHYFRGGERVAERVAPQGK